MSKHTPGRWWINEKRHDDYPTKISIETDSYNICLVDGGLDQQANANLIAAAPDMLEALEKCVIRLEANLDDEKEMGRGSMTYLLETCSTAIARAKGESQ